MSSKITIAENVLIINKDKSDRMLTLIIGISSSIAGIAALIVILFPIEHTTAWEYFSVLLGTCVFLFSALSHLNRWVHDIDIKMAFNCDTIELNEYRINKVHLDTILIIQNLLDSEI